MNSGPPGSKSWRAAFLLSVGKHVVKQKRRKLTDAVQPRKNNKNRPSFKENGLFLAAEGELESAISAL